MMCINFDRWWTFGFPFGRLGSHVSIWGDSSGCVAFAVMDHEETESTCGIATWPNQKPHERIEISSKPKLFLSLGIYVDICTQLYRIYKWSPPLSRSWAPAGISATCHLGVHWAETSTAGGRSLQSRWWPQKPLLLETYMSWWWALAPPIPVIISTETCMYHLRLSGGFFTKCRPSAFVLDSLICCVVPC